jgi:sensor c-di-GMP phosphodiesterase-like protein
VIGKGLRALSRKDVLAMVAGVFLAGAPLIAFNVWLSGLIERQGQGEVDTSAKRAIALAEARVSQAVRAVDSLVSVGVDSCRPDDITLMRQAAFATVPVKEIALLSADGQVLCSDLGLAPGERKSLSSEPLTGAGGYSFDLMQIGNERMARLSRKTAAGNQSIAAMMPIILFLPQVSTNGEPFSAKASVTTRQGHVIGEAAEKPPASDDIVARVTSDKYGFNAEVSVPRARVLAEYEFLQRLGVFAAGAVAFILIGFAVLMPRRRATSSNPVAEIERALEAGEFVPYYQPIVDIRSGQLRGAEVLVRWRKPDGTLILPGAFIPLAESSGLILDMTRDLMRRTCADVGTAIGRRPALKISFNFAGKLFADESIVKDVRNIFAGSPIHLSQVVLEVTERDPIENLTETRRIIAALQGIGVRIAIDDVGTGHSGLSYMLKLGVDIIKIDKMFVDAIGTDRNSTTIVETLVDLAHNMRMDVVAEGVENFEQVMHLRELGIRSAQGYVFAPPLPGSGFLQLLEAIDPLPAAVVEEKVAGAARRYMSARKSFGAA